MADKLGLLVCQNIGREAALAIQKEGYSDVEVITFPAMCHRPQADLTIIQATADKYRPNYSQICLLSGCLRSRISTALPGLSCWMPTAIDTCFKMFANPAIIDHYLAQGSYLVTPGWLTDWQHQLQAWGFDRQTSRDFFNEFADRLVVLDTGSSGSCPDDMRAFANFVDLPYEILPVGLDHFQLFLTKIILAWQMEQQQAIAAETLANTERLAATHAMVLELISKLTQTMTEAEAIENVLDLFVMLFAPGQLIYVPQGTGQAERMIARPALSATDIPGAIERLGRLSDDYDWTQSGRGFVLRISHRQEPLGMLEADQVAFPEYLELYLNHALTIVGVCGLAIANARTYQQITEQKNELAQTLTELRKTQHHLVQAEKMASLGNLVAGVAHEISTPIGVGITSISSLIGKNEQITQRYQAQTMTRADLENFLAFSTTACHLTLSNLQRTGELIQGFKQVSVDQVTEQQRRFNLSAYLHQIIRNLGNRLKAKNIKVEIDCDENLDLNSYPGVIAQIITNLVLNSEIHGFPQASGGQITITVSSHPHTLIMVYLDNGLGIAADILPKIFDPFFTTNKQQGTGLGLHIVYNLITQKLKGTIACKSEPGHGTLFELTLPLKSKP